MLPEAIIITNRTEKTIHRVSISKKAEDILASFALLSCLKTTLLGLIDLAKAFDTIDQAV